LSIAAGRGLIARQALELKPIEKLKYKIKTKSPTEFRPAGTAADSELQLIVSTSCPAFRFVFIISLIKLLLLLLFFFASFFFVNWCANVDKLHLTNQPASISELQPCKILRSIASSNLMLVF